MAIAAIVNGAATQIVASALENIVISTVMPKGIRKVAVPIFNQTLSKYFEPYAYSSDQPTCRQGPIHAVVANRSFSDNVTVPIVFHLEANSQSSPAPVSLDISVSSLTQEQSKGILTQNQSITLDLNKNLGHVMVPIVYNCAAVEESHGDLFVDVKQAGFGAGEQL